MKRLAEHMVDWRADEALAPSAPRAPIFRSESDVDKFVNGASLLVGGAKTSEAGFEAFEDCAACIGAALGASRFRRHAIDRLHQIAEAAGLPASHGDNAVQDVLAAAFGDRATLSASFSAAAAEFHRERERRPNGQADAGRQFDASGERPTGHAEAIAPPPPLEVICPTELEGRPIPDRRWLVRDWIPAGVVTGIYGNGGVGKSLISQQLQTAAALGLPWLGLPVEPTRSLGIYCEDSADELHRRQNCIDATYDCRFSDLSGVHWLSRTDDDNLLMTFTNRGVGELTRFHVQLKERALDLRVGVLIFDTVADGFGGNENDRGHVRQFVGRALGSIASAIDGAVIACAHPSRNGLTTGEGDGGSTGWNNAFRSRLFLSAPDQKDDEPPDSDARILQRKKANYASRLDQFKLRWRNGVIIPDQPFQAASGTFGRREPNDVFLALLDDFTGSGRLVSASQNAGNFAPRAFAAVAPAQRDNYTRADFKRAMESLFAQRAIKLADYGRAHDKRQKITRAEP